MAIKVLIADQERTFAEALAIRLEDEDDINVVAAVQVKTPDPRLIAAMSFDVMVVDGDLPGGATNQLCATARARAASPRVITLSSTSEPERILSAIRAGTAAWVRKDQSLADLLCVIRGVTRGETWLPPSETGNVVRLLMQEEDRRREKGRLLASLTPRERAVLACLAQGTGHRDAIAKQLHLSVNTVRTHLQNIMAKLGVHSALEAVALTRDEWNSPPETTVPRPSPPPDAAAATQAGLPPRGGVRNAPSHGEQRLAHQPSARHALMAEPDDPDDMEQIVAQAAGELADASPDDILRWAITTFGDRICVTSSMTDAVIIHMASAIRPGIDVIFLDTGYHFAETIGTRDAVAAVYPVSLVNVTPSRTVAEQDAELGPRLYQRNPDLCCYLRKVEPLERALSRYDAWITGVRRDETVDRREARPVEWDDRRKMVKVNPIVSWQQKQVDDYIAENGILVNPLVYDGYPSIGCSTCTRRVASGEDPRAGRWAGTGKTECGIHLLGGR
jgi:phosphoadenosine phosphosulfate reductase